jgi:hypothetical protein
MSDIKQAALDHPVHELIAKRWSPYAFSDRAVSTKDLQSLFEAARWTASSNNEQPWRYIVAWWKAISRGQRWHRSSPSVARF